MNLESKLDLFAIGGPNVNLNYLTKDKRVYRHEKCRIMRCGGVLDRCALGIPNLVGLVIINVMFF